MIFLWRGGGGAEIQKYKQFLMYLFILVTLIQRLCVCINEEEKELSGTFTIILFLSFLRYALLVFQVLLIFTFLLVYTLLSLTMLADV